MPIYGAIPSRASQGCAISPILFNIFIHNQNNNIKTWLVQSLYDTVTGHSHWCPVQRKKGHTTWRVKRKTYLSLNQCRMVWVAGNTSVPHHVPPQPWWGNMGAELVQIDSRGQSQKLKGEQVPRTNCHGEGMAGETLHRVVMQTMEL